MRVRSGLVAASLGAVLFVAQAGAGETPKYGGTLTYMIPADAPPSLTVIARPHMRPSIRQRPSIAC
jgi:hypothetical protein